MNENERLVSPSAEEVAKLLYRRRITVYPVTWEDAQPYMRASLIEEANAVLALFASQPTVAEVLEPVQALVDGRSDIGQPFRPPNMTTRVIHRGDVAAALERARTGTRAEAKGGE